MDSYGKRICLPAIARINVTGGENRKSGGQPPGTPGANSGRRGGQKVEKKRRSSDLDTTGVAAAEAAEGAISLSITSIHLFFCSCYLLFFYVLLLFSINI